MALLEQAIMGQNTPQTALTQGQAQSQARMQSILPQAQQAQKYNAGLQPQSISMGDAMAAEFESKYASPAEPSTTQLPVHSYQRPMPPAQPTQEQIAAAKEQFMAGWQQPQRFGTNNAIVRLR